MGCIYKVTNLINNKVYIGQTKYTAEWRWQTHLRDAFNIDSENYNVIFHKAIRKYGIENFKVEEIEQCTTKCLSTKEQYWISYYDSFNKDKGYNMTLGGEGSKIYNDEEILGLWNQGYAISEVTRLLPYKISSSTVRRILLGNGVNIDEMHERKRKILVHNNTKVVYQYDKNGMFLKTFYSASQAGRELHISDINIAQAANGQIKSAGGFYGVMNIMRK